MKISQIENFVTVIDCGSINKASEKLYITQPTLSRSIQMLESEIGKKLLERSSTGITATSTGKLFYYYGKSILKQINTLKQIKDYDEHSSYAKLSISVNSIFIKDDLILKSYEQFHLEHTELYVYETTAEQALSDVATSQSEVGIIVLNDLQLKMLNSRAEKQGINVIVVDESPIYVHLNEKLVPHQKETVSIKDLEDLTLVRFPPDLFSHLNNVIQVDKQAITDFKKTLTMSNYHSMLNITSKSHAFMFGHKWQIDELKNLNLKSLRLENSQVKKYLVLLMRKDDILSNPVCVLLKKIFEHYHLDSYVKKA